MKRQTALLLVILGLLVVGLLVVGYVTPTLRKPAVLNLANTSGKVVRNLEVSSSTSGPFTWTMIGDGDSVSLPLETAGSVGMIRGTFDDGTSLRGSFAYSENPRTFDLVISSDGSVNLP